MTILIDRPADVIHDAITARHRDLCSAHAALLAEIGAHDRVSAWRRMGTRSEEDYLVRYHQVKWGTAKDWARQARVLGRHPEIAAALADGEMSIDKLDAACRLAEAQDNAALLPDPGPDPPDPQPPPDPSDPSDPSDQPPPDPPPDPPPPPGPQPDPAAAAAELLDLIDAMSAQQLADIARRAQQARAAEADALHRRRHLMVVRDAGGRSVSIKFGELFDDDAAIVWAAFADYVANTKPDPATCEQLPLKARFADALVAMAHAYFTARGNLAHRPFVFFHADARVLAGEDGWAETSDHSPLAAETARRLACMCKLGAVADDAAGNPLNLGRRAREASWQQFEFLRRRDGGCRQCGAQLFLQSHHIKWWDRDEGRTDMANLVLLCQPATTSATKGAG